jgi:hypothetical protein
MPGGLHDSSLTRVRPFFSGLVEADPSGASWLGKLLKAAPRGRLVLGDLLEKPGVLLAATLGPHPTVSSVPRACFEFPVPPDRRLLRWLASHPDSLVWPPSATYSEGTATWRRALLYDEPPGRERAMKAALEEIERRSPATRGWWRFEGTSMIDCVLLTDQLVVTIEGKRTEPLSAATDWYPRRSQLVRNLEAARQLARGRRWASLLLSEHPVSEGSEAALAASLDDGAPHIDDRERAELQAAYLGNLTWAEACTATGIEFGSLPETAAGSAA